MAVKKTTTAHVSKTNKVTPATPSNSNSQSGTSSNSTPSTTSAACNAFDTFVCWSDSYFGTNAAAYQNCIANCGQNIQIGSTQPGAIIPSSSGVTPANMQDLGIRGALIIIGVIFVIIGVTRMFGGNKQFNIQLQTPDRPHRFGGAPPPPPPPQPRPQAAPPPPTVKAPPMKSRSGPYIGAPGTIMQDRKDTF